MGFGAGFQGGHGYKHLKPGKGYFWSEVDGKPRAAETRGHQAAEGRTRPSGPRAVLRLVGHTETESPFQPFDSLSLTLHLLGGI